MGWCKLGARGGIGRQPAVVVHQARREGRDRSGSPWCWCTDSSRASTSTGAGQCQTYCIMYLTSAILAALSFFTR
eukprot:1796023-Pyramimonas_sp.AAC.1